MNKFTEAELTSIRSAAVVLLPDRGYGDYDGDVYPVQTEELYAHLTDRGLSVEYSVADSDFKQLALHSDLIVLPTIWLVAKHVAVLTLAHVIYEFIHERLGSRHKQADMKIRIIVDHESGKSDIHCEGPVVDFETSVTRELKPKDAASPVQSLEVKGTTKHDD